MNTKEALTLLSPKDLTVNITYTQKQAEYLDALLNGPDFTEFVFFGGFASGKSLAVMVATFLLCLTYPKSNWLFVRETYPELKDSVIKQWLEVFPQIEYVYVKSERQAIFNNGSIVNFRAFDKDTKILSNEYMGVSICQAEEVPYELFLQVFGRNRNRKNGIPKNYLLVEGNPSAGWVKHRYKDSPLPQNTFFIEAKTMDNPYISQEYVDTLIREYPDHWVKRYVYGEWANYDEMVLSEFMESVHVVEPFTISKHWKKVIGMDYGFTNPSAMIWLAIDHDHKIYAFDEFYESKKTVKELHAEWSRHGKILTAIDPSTQGARELSSIYEDLQKLGTYLTPANNEKLAGLNSINSLLKQKRLFIFRNCQNLIKEIVNYKWKRLKLGDQKNLPEETIKKDDHAVDALRYGIMYLRDLKVTEPSPTGIYKTIDEMVKSRSKKSNLTRLG